MVVFQILNCVHHLKQVKKHWLECRDRKLTPNPYPKLRERHLEQPLCRAIGQHPCTGQAVPLLCAKLIEHRAWWQKAFTAANNSNPSKSLTEWLIHGYMKTLEHHAAMKRMSYTYMDFTHLAFLLNIYVPGSFKKIFIYFWLYQFLVAASLVVVRGLSCPVA